jgi:sugar lactone lactonase YvrE
MRLQLRSLVAAVALLFAASPFARAVDLLYVTMGNHTIVTYDTTGNVGATILATQVTFASTNLSSPQGLAFDLSGNLYAANNTGNTISKFDSAGLFKGSISSNLSGPRGLAFDSSGNLYAANVTGSTISKFDSADIFKSSISSNLSAPQGLAFDSSGNLYAANGTGNTISKFNSLGNFDTNITSNLSTPNGLAFDSSGNLYASNSGNNTISKFDSAGLFKGSISSNLNSPRGLAFDSLGNLYAVNAGNDSISKFNPDGNFVTSWLTTATPRSIAFKPVTVPEPSTYALAAIATGVMATIARRRKARRLDSNPETGGKRLLSSRSWR